MANVRQIINSLEDEIIGRKELILKEMINSRSSAVRSRALREIASSGLLINEIDWDEFFEEPSPEVRKAFVKLLVETANTTELAEIALKDPVETVRAAAAKAYAESDQVEESELERIFEDPSKKVRKAFLLSLIKNGIDPDEIMFLTSDPSIEIRNIYRAYKGELELDESIVSDLPKTVQRLLLEDHFKNKDDDSCNEVIKLVNSSRFPGFKTLLVEFIGTYPEETARRGLEKLMKNDDPVVMLTAIKTYMKSFDFGSELLPLAETLMEENDEEKRYLAAKIFKKLKEPSTVEILRGNIDDPSDRVRATIIETLGSMMDYTLEHEIKFALNSTSSKLKKAALKATRKLKLTDTAEDITGIINNRKESLPVQKLAVSVAGFLRIGESLPALEKILLDQFADAALRLSCAKSVARISPSRLEELLGYIG
ncbi:MAG: HEAT repeat domain-containing protein [Thermotogota bacterium]|nr:HEAT repeat domain-containing protein [Thermotogota bacterium]